MGVDTRSLSQGYTCQESGGVEEWGSEICSCLLENRYKSLKALCNQIFKF